VHFREHPPTGVLLKTERKTGDDDEGGSRERVMIAEAKHPYPRRLEGRALLGSTHRYPLATTKKKSGSAPSAGGEKEASARRLKRGQSVPVLDPNTRQRKGDLKW
jgi:hypothetical protein